MTTNSRVCSSIVRTTLGLCAFAMLAHTAQAQDARTLDATRCAELASTTIMPAQIGLPVSAIHIDSAAWVDTAPAHCRIDGRLEPVDQSATARPITFGVALPPQWNGRAVQLGGGGMNGTVPMLAGRGEQSELGRGYATYGSDSGHSMRDDGSWLLNDEAIQNLGFAQMKKTHDAAFVLIEAAYGAKPEYNYYVGGSQGGREGLTMAQRYPADYDGVMSSVPIVGLSTLMVAPALIRIQEKPLENWVSASMGPLLLKEIMRQCDALDGLNDGVINNYVDCRAQFNVNDGKGDDDPWAALRCPGAANASCLTAAQIETLGFIFSTYEPGVALPNGRTTFGMWAPTTAIGSEGPSFGNMPMAPPGALLMSRRYAGQEGAEADAPNFFTLGTEGVTGILMQDNASNPLDYNIAQHGARHAQVAQWLDSTQSDLSEFSQRGGKIIFAIGTDDTVAPSGEQLDYYQSLVDTMGRDKLDGFARLYVLPQTGHGLTGQSAAIDGDGNTRTPAPIPATSDRFALLTAWVERGEAPGMSVEVNGASGTLPMCSYPEYPHYQGGDASQAAAYRCTRPRLAD
jgi:pimeloyl-ACP methyl ester carboxylesterase